MTCLLVHGNTRCSYGMLWLVHGNDIVINTYEMLVCSQHVTVVAWELQLMISVLYFASSLFFWVLCKLSLYPCPHFSCVYGLHNLQSFTNCRSFLVLNWDPHAWVLLIGVYLYNKLLGNTYLKSSPHLRYFDSIFTRICTHIIRLQNIWPCTIIQNIFQE